MSFFSKLEDMLNMISVPIVVPESSSHLAREQFDYFGDRDSFFL